VHLAVAHQQHDGEAGGQRLVSEERSKIVPSCIGARCGSI
jgi:hypothetical protein